MNEKELQDHVVNVYAQTLEKLGDVVKADDTTAGDLVVKAVALEVVKSEILKLVRTKTGNDAAYIEMLGQLPNCAEFRLIAENP